MMRYVIVLCALFLAGCGERVATVTGSGVRVRSAPTLRASTVGFLALGETVMVHDSGRDGFSRVDFRGNTGYVATVYLCDTTPRDARSQLVLFVIGLCNASVGDLFFLGFVLVAGMVGAMLLWRAVPGRYRGGRHRSGAGPLPWSSRRAWSRRMAA